MSSANPVFATAQLKSPLVLFVTALGSGLMRPAPGTWGSLLGLLLWFVLLAPLSPIEQLIVIVVVFSLGVWACNRIEAQLGLHDPGAIVIDEVVGIWITLLGFGQDWLWALLGFALFRLFDITKPGIVRWADNNVGGGFGVMFDDVLAGCLAAIVLQFAFLLALFTGPSLFS